MARFKIASLFKGLKKAQEILEALEANGIDVDRLIGISNSQGPQGRMIKDLLSQDIPVDDKAPSQTRPGPKRKTLSSKSKG